ncbi:hypothetical protein CCP4SC76_3180004 [Gammaproteobacteria bacterium]
MPGYPQSRGQALVLPGCVLSPVAVAAIRKDLMFGANYTAVFTWLVCSHGLGPCLRVRIAFGVCPQTGWFPLGYCSIGA